jgi:hypothetical protein
MHRCVFAPGPLVRDVVEERRHLAARVLDLDRARREAVVVVRRRRREGRVGAERGEAAQHADDQECEKEFPLLVAHSIPFS